METTNSLFLQLAIVLGLSASIGFVIRALRLPLLVAYLLAGVVLSFMQILGLEASKTLTFLPEIGIAFVLFFIGMELDMAEIKSLGKPILVASLGQIIISAISGFAISSLLGFPQKEAIFLGIGLSVSSTIVVIKLLLEKKEMASLYGKLAIGILLLEDLVSVIILMGLTVGSSILGLGLQNSLPLLALILKGVILFALAAILSHLCLTRVFRAVASSQELLFLSAIAWCFMFVAVSLLLGFSVVIGAFLAGIALANSPFHFEIQGKVKPLRDFFVVLFFVYLGSQVVFTDLPQLLPVVAILTLFALIVKPLIFLLILGSFGFRKHTIFQTSLSLSQISEFSLIILVVGEGLGLVSQGAVTAMALVGIISITLSSVMISKSRRIYKLLAPFIGSFVMDKFVHEIEMPRNDLEMDDHVILIGAHRLGRQVASFLQKEKVPLLVLDFNPKVVKELSDAGIHALYGDVGDPEILDLINLNKARLIISTAPSEDDNLILLSEVRKRRAKSVVLARASSVNEADSLYKAGADYVILPEIVASDFITKILKDHWPNLEYFKSRSQIELNKFSRTHLATT